MSAPVLAFDQHGALHATDAAPAWRDPLDKRAWLVRPIAHRDAVRFVEAHHYAASASNTSVARFGLFHKDGDALLGVAIYLPPPGRAALALGVDRPRDVLALSRLALHPSVPRNGASFLITRSVRALPDRYGDLLTYADEARGHVGTVYQASNWRYRGPTRPAPLYRDADDRVVSRKRGPNTLTHGDMLERGYRLVGRFTRHAYHLRRADLHAHPDLPYPKLAPRLFAPTAS